MNINFSLNQILLNRIKINVKEIQRVGIREGEIN